LDAHLLTGEFEFTSAFIDHAFQFSVSFPKLPQAHQGKCKKQNQQGDAAKPEKPNSTVVDGSPDKPAPAFREHMDRTAQESFRLSAGAQDKRLRL